MKKFYTKNAAIRAAHNAIDPMLVIIPSNAPKCYVATSIYSTLATDKAVAFIHGDYIHEFEDGR